MGTGQWKVVKSFDSANKYEIEISPKIIKTFEKFNLGEIIIPKDFAASHVNDKDWQKQKENKLLNLHAISGLHLSTQ